jgi:hypothetical protein
LYWTRRKVIDVLTSRTPSMVASRVITKRSIPAMSLATTRTI